MLNLAGILGDSIVDGPGLRMTVFAQGCPHHCKGCHNEETWPFEGGTAISEQDVFDIIKQNPLCKGVTFSGGEPFCQAEAFASLARMLKAHGYEIAAYTGYLFETLLENAAHRALLAEIDVLIDGPFVLAEKSLQLNFRGSRNQRILNAKKSLAAGKAILEDSPRWRGEY